MHKKIFLIDTCAWVNLYKDNPELKSKVQFFVDRTSLDIATLFMPNFCIAEVFNTFAQWRYRECCINEDDYEKIKEDFKKHIRRGGVMQEYPLHIYHIYNIDYVIPFEHQWNLGRNKTEHLSTYDMLIISMGIELVKNYGDDCCRIVTCDNRLEYICNHMRDKVNEAIKKRYNIPDWVIYPQTINLLRSSIDNVYEFIKK
jgi:hypothetical protein